METQRIGLSLAIAEPAFNFLASLINGNVKSQTSPPTHHFSTFNFLASLINGNLREPRRPQ